MESTWKLNRNQLKYIAIIAMLIDHIAWTFVPTYSLLGQIMHVIGRMTGPIMAFMIAEGYEHTRNIKKYALRMFLFTLVSWIPYSLHSTGRWPTDQFGVILTLFFGLISIWIWDKVKIPTFLKVLIVIALCIASLFLGDWPIFDILWPLFLFIYRDKPKKKWTSFTIITAAEILLSQLMALTSSRPYGQLFQIGAIVVPPLLIWGYNGKPGSKNAFHKWFFYVFYPTHLLILWALEVYVFTNH